MQIKFRLDPPQSANPWRKLVMFIIALALAIPLLMFSAAVLVVLLVVGVIVGGIFWWKTRALRQQMREMRDFQPQSPVMDDTGGTGEIIEGEVIRVVRTRDEQ
ncbi:MAG: hypothetical protein WAO71_09590 [Gallionella sp.]